MAGWSRRRHAVRRKRAAIPVQSRCTHSLSHTRGSGGRLLDPSCELEVLKCIMVREGYLARVARLAEDTMRRAERGCDQLHRLPPGMVDLLDLLRTASLETVEAISLWRLSQVGPKLSAFEWNGHNYLVKMLRDCDFLDRYEALHRWLGFRLVGNPFFFPPQGCIKTEADRGLSVQKSSQPGLEFDNIGLADVGQQPWLGPLEFEVVEDREDVRGGKGERPKKRKQQKAGVVCSLAPYAAAVVNDFTLLPPVRSLPPTRPGDPETTESTGGSWIDSLGFNPNKVNVSIEDLVPNIVSREDAQRIGVATQVLVEEQGRVQEASNASGIALRDDVHHRRTRALSTASNAASIAAQMDSRASVVSSPGSPIKRKISGFGQRTTTQSGSSVRTRSLVSQAVSKQPETRDVRSIVLTTAGLLGQPPPEPHPSLGPVRVRSDYPGGELHPRPIIHTVSDARQVETGDLEPEIHIRIPSRRRPNTRDGSSASSFASRCSTSHPITAPPSVPTTMPEIHMPPFSDEAEPVSSLWSQEMETPSAAYPKSAETQAAEREHPGPDFRSRGLRLCRKAGAELRALTAAGTSGRRQPPPRESRLRRLARDIARHSAEVRRLLVEEDQLRRRLARGSYGDRRSRDTGFSSDPHESIAPEVAFGRDDPLAATVSVRDANGAARRVSIASAEAGTPRSRAEKIETLLVEKRREIDTKAFGLTIKRDELRCLRMVQKQERERRVGLEMERRRARLGEGQRLIEDEAVASALEDSSCILIQKRVRGNSGRKFAAWHKGAIVQAATTIQRGVRFIWDRRATKRRILLHASAKPMQSAFRMHVTRQRYKLLLRQRRELVAASKVVSRGMLGRRRAAARRMMVAAATKALDWVSLGKLQPKHLRELARAIYGALVDPVRQFPPAGVLGAIRVVLTMLDDEDSVSNSARVASSGSGSGGGGGGGAGGEMVTFQTALGRTVRGVVSAPNLTWEMAARVLLRPFRLLRRMRAFASGLGAASDATPARLLRLSPRAVGLLSAYRGDPSWSLEALSAVTEGRTAAKAFVGWAMELEKVYREQPRVEVFLRDAQPAWLRKGRSFQRRRRALELHAEACRRSEAVAVEHRQHLKGRGRAYGDPVLALEVLQKRCREAEEALRQLESRKMEFLAVQEKAEDNAGRALKEDVEFAEREASVAAREEEMARRLGESGPDDLAYLAGKTRDCAVIVRELQRRLRVWERRCQEHKRPLLEEWVPPSGDQVSMARALGEIRAWQQITAVQKARLLEEAGGSRFVKGLTGKKLEVWRSAAEGLAACGADIESREARLAENVVRFERDLMRANAEIAAEEVNSARWDNATEETRALERQEDADAACDERRMAMGVTLPPGLLENRPRLIATGGERWASSPSAAAADGFLHRPTLLLLGLDLPASVRKGIREGLDREVPGLFARHVEGADALPALAQFAAQSAAAAAAAAPGGGRGFLETCREAGAVATTTSSKHPRADVAATNRKFTTEAGVMPGAAATTGWDGSSWVGPDGSGDAGAETRANLVQAALSGGKSVSLEVVPGPGLWARGRFLRDLEAILGGLDDECPAEGGGIDRNSSRKRFTPTVLLVDGHGRNRSGGGADLGHGTKLAGQVTPQTARAGHCSKLGLSQREGSEDNSHPPASAAAMRVKALLEKAAQCLYDLATAHGEVPTPFRAILAASRASPSQHGPQEEGRQDHSGSSSMPRSLSARVAAPGRLNSPSTTKGYPAMDLLLAACQMMVHPDRRYDVGESQAFRNRVRATSTNNVIEPNSTAAPPDDAEASERESVASLAYASHLAAVCRKELAEKHSARGVAELLRGAEPEAVPLETAVALRRLVRHPEWPLSSSCPGFVDCRASRAFIGWVVAAVAGATELALEGGGGGLRAGSGADPKSLRGMCRAEAGSYREVEERVLYGETLGTRSTTEDGERKPLKSLWQTSKEAHEARQREQRLLQRMQEELIDENVTVLDDDSLWLWPPEEARDDGDAQRRRQCRTSEVLDALIETALRPFIVSVEPNCRIALATNSQSRATSFACSPAPKPPGDGARFSVTVSRAFGWIYARTVSLGTGRMRRGLVYMARTRDQDLIQLLSPNWMEKNDLSALRELRTEPAVWRALINTLVLRYPSETAPRRGKARTLFQQDTGFASSDSSPTSVSQHKHKPLAASPGYVSSSVDGSRAGVLSFRHVRRLTLVTSCLLMGRVVPVSVFEESRSDFWCEAEVPAALTVAGCAACPVGMRVPKECIPLILDSSHPMRMRTILNPSDMRHLSTLIADRLKLCRVGSGQTGSRSYRYWLNGAIDPESRSESLEGSTADGSIAGVETAEPCDQGQSGPEFKLTLRKRSVGQVVFSRLVSLWVPPSENLEADKGPSGATNSHVTRERGTGGHDGSCAPAGHVVRRLVIVKEFAHRGECGELRGEVYDPDSGDNAEAFDMTNGLARILLGGWIRELKASDRTSRSASARYWRDALTWRLRLLPDAPLFGGGEVKNLEGNGHIAPSISPHQDAPGHRLVADDREPLFSIRVAARLETYSKAGERDEGSFATRKACFDVLMLPPHPEPGTPHAHNRGRSAAIELVATHRPTMAVFAFSVPSKALAKAFDAVVAACLIAPTALSPELQQPMPELSDIVGTWLLFSVRNDRRGRRATLTLSFPGIKAVVAEPYVSLRCPANTNDIDEKSNPNPDGQAEDDEDGVSTPVAVAPNVFSRDCTPGRKRGSQNTRGSVPAGARRSLRNSIKTLPVETRNERMVFRQSLAVPRSADPDERLQENFVDRPGDARGRIEEPASKVLALSVYEVFASGSTGKIERQLRFCARDEDVRPAVETVTTIPWVGTCEGLEGSRLWRVVTQGLTFVCMRNRTGKCVEMRLNVSTEVESGDGAGLRPAMGLERKDGEQVHAKLERESDASSNSLEDAEAATEVARRGHGLSGNGHLQAFARYSQREAGKERSALRDEFTVLGTGLDNHVINFVGLRTEQHGAESNTTHAVGPKFKREEDDVDPEVASCSSSRLSELLKERGEAGTCVESRTASRTIKIYSGWHQITGVRLHVQCFQDHAGTWDADADAGGRTDASGRVAGRGGVVGLPRAAFLRFLVCSPSTGARSTINLSADDVCRNLSVDGGIVETALLEAGRRPALARAIAEKLRLVFEAGGGYRVALPLPAQWNMASQQAG